jgi:hypothetical protein
VRNYFEPDAFSNAVKLSRNATPAPSYPSGFANTANLVCNGSALVRTASTFGNGVLLTDGGPNEAGSIYYAAPQNVQAFTTDFTFDICCEVTEADGLTFTIQNDGPEAVGSVGGGLGYCRHSFQGYVLALVGD